MTFRIVAGAIAALAFAGAAHAETGATNSSGTDTQTMAPPAQDCSVYTAEGCTPGAIGDSTQSQSYGGGQWGAPADQSQSQAADETQSSERWRRPERHGWRRILLPVDFVREGASAVKHKF